jgi:hypothetical protein
MYVFPKKNPAQINKGFKAIRCLSNSQNTFHYPQMEACVEAEQNRDGFWKEKSKNLTCKKKHLRKLFGVKRICFFFFRGSRTRDNLS